MWEYFYRPDAEVTVGNPWNGASELTTESAPGARWNSTDYSLAQRPQSLSKKDTRPETHKHSYLIVHFPSYLIPSAVEKETTATWSERRRSLVFVMHQINSRVISSPLRAPRFLRSEIQGRKRKRANVQTSRRRARLRWYQGQGAESGPN